MWKKWVFIAVTVLIIIWFIPYSLPLIFAFATALFLEGLVDFFQRKFNFNRLQAVLATFISYLLGIVVVGYNLFALIVQQIMNLSQTTPSFVKDFYVSTLLPIINRLQAYSQTLPKEVISSIQSTIEKSVNSLDLFSQRLLEATINLLTAIPGFMIEFLIYLVALFLITLELPRLKSKFSEFMTEETRGKVFLVANQLTKAGVGFIKAQIILSALTFALAFTGLWILKAPNIGLISLLIVAVDILPILGTGSVLVPWGVIAILQENHFLGIGLIILFVIITVVRRIVEPKVYSTNLGISPLASLVSLYIGFKILGFIGLFAGPALVIVYDTLRKANIIQYNFKI